MIKMYKTSSYDNRIEEKEFIEVSKSSVFWLDEKGKKQRESIENHYHFWHKSKEEAVLYLKEKWENQIKIAESEIERLKKKLAELGF
jgi:predicted DNA binding CopG/RHH family protein